MFPMNENWFKVSKKEKDTIPILECCRGILLVNFDFFRTELEPPCKEKKNYFIHTQTYTNKPDLNWFLLLFLNKI